MGRKSIRAEVNSGKDVGDSPIGDAMEIDSTPAPVVDKKKAAADARAERAARRKQLREETVSKQPSTNSLPASTPIPEAEPASTIQAEKKTKRVRSEKKSANKSGKKKVQVEVPAEAETEAETTPEAVAAEEAAVKVPAAEDVATEAPAPSQPAAIPSIETASDKISSTEPTPIEAPSNEPEPLPFVIDVNPTKVHITQHDSTSRAVSEKATSVAPSSVNGEGLNRAARRRLIQIDKRRGIIKKDLGIPADSDERQEEVNQILGAWIADFDEKVRVRAESKVAKKEAALNRRKTSKQFGGRNNYEKQKKVKKDKQKVALRQRQEGISRMN
ncbi:hypothetical protein CTRI78_v007516 [Colletotrichum trifolii]|uniref:Uncharacterized protein n=1 Tax=Colletotrichum trifolii TaxID=5466 RepID=A0A4R8R9R1_COLTR|nr:hypothetical protein CTRI78_v007516 [Colletotrichum trifolii]